MTVEPEKIYVGSAHTLAGSKTGKLNIFKMVTTWVLNMCWVIQENLENLQYIHGNCNPSEKKYVQRKTNGYFIFKMDIPDMSFIFIM